MNIEIDHYFWQWQMAPCIFMANDLIQLDWLDLCSKDNGWMIFFNTILTGQK